MKTREKKILIEVEPHIKTIKITNINIDFDDNGDYFIIFNKVWWQLQQHPCSMIEHISALANIIDEWSSTR